MDKCGKRYVTRNWGEGEGADGEISTEGNIIIKTQRQKKGGVFGLIGVISRKRLAVTTGIRRALIDGGKGQGIFWAIHSSHFGWRRKGKSANPFFFLFFGGGGGFFWFVCLL